MADVCKMFAASRFVARRASRDRQKPRQMRRFGEVRRRGFEPPTFGFVDQRSIQLSYRRTIASLFGDP